MVLEAKTNKLARLNLDESASDAAVAKAKLDVAEAELAVAEEELTIAKAKLASAEAAGADAATRDPLEVAVAEAKAAVAEDKLTVARERGVSPAEQEGLLQDLQQGASKRAPSRSGNVELTRSSTLSASGT